jgi:hypothetical protein
MTIGYMTFAEINAENSVAMVFSAAPQVRLEPVDRLVDPLPGPVDSMSAGWDIRRSLRSQQ